MEPFSVTHVYVSLSEKEVRKETKCTPGSSLLIIDKWSLEQFWLLKELGDFIQWRCTLAFYVLELEDQFLFFSFQHTLSISCVLSIVLGILRVWVHLILTEALLGRYDLGKYLIAWTKNLPWFRWLFGPYPVRLVMLPQWQKHTLRAAATGEPSDSSRLLTVSLVPFLSHCKIYGCTPKANTMWYVDDISIKLGGKRKRVSTERNEGQS